MSTTFMTSPKHLFTSESVSEGHPDKICDQISDAILDAILKQDPMARVACEVAISSDLVVVLGEITAKADIEYEKIVRRTIADIGYTAESGFDAESCKVLLSINQQSSDIQQGVDREGAGDQGMMIGFACDETPERMPLTVSLAHRLVRRLAKARKTKELPWLRPDAKSQVTVEYAGGIPQRVDTIVISTQHVPEISQAHIHQQVKEHIIRAVVPNDLIDDATRFIINPTGRFEQGGPAADAGLTGRKVIVDTYGGAARHGGGAFSGKDATKVDRSAAYMARYAAKNVVAAGLAKRFELQVSYAIGRAEPTSLAIETFGTGQVADEIIERLIQEHFDMRPTAIIRGLGLRRPIYKPVAAYGHFGREDVDAPWEQTDKAEILRRQAGLS